MGQDCSQLALPGVWQEKEALRWWRESGEAKPGKMHAEEHQYLLEKSETVDHFEIVFDSNAE